VSKNGKDPTPLQMLGIGAVVALALGAHIRRQASRSPAERAKAAEDNRQRHAEKRAYEVRWKKAWELDRAHWKAFEEDSEAQDRLANEVYVPVDVPPAGGPVEKTSGGSFWAITVRYRVTNGDDALTFWHHLDGGYLGLGLDSPNGSFTCDVGAPAGRLTIGECDGAPSPLQRRAAALLGAIQEQGHFAGRRICAVLANRAEVRDRHYAEYARARGWDTQRNGAADRVQREYYASNRA
jgi:hypothetical protein